MAAATRRTLPGPAWVPAGRRLKAWEAVPIVEPYPRAPPKEIASGLSFREGGARFLPFLPPSASSRPFTAD